MNKHLVLKDGTEIQGGSASNMNEKLLIKIPGNDIVSATVMFSDPDKTETITAYYSVYKNTYHGYTQMYSVQYFANRDEIQVWLKGEDVSKETEYTVPQQYLPKEMRTEDE